MGGALIGLFFFATLYLQLVLGYGPLKAGASFLPLALTIGAAAGLASSLATKFGPKPVLVAGLVVQAAGLYWFSHVSAGGSYLGDVLFPSLVVALGMGLAFVPLTIAAMSGVSEDASGLASGVMATAQQIGQARRPRDPDRRRQHDGGHPRDPDEQLRGRVPGRRRLRAAGRAGGVHDHPPRQGPAGGRRGAGPGLDQTRWGGPGNRFRPAASAAGRRTRTRGRHRPRVLRGRATR